MRNLALTRRCVVGLDHVFGELSISQLRLHPRLDVTLEVIPEPGWMLRGVTVVEGQCDV